MSDSYRLINHKGSHKNNLTFNLALLPFSFLEIKLNYP